jgi:hypothetical protein
MVQLLQALRPQEAAGEERESASDSV